MIRAKFKVESLEHTVDYANVKMTPVIGGSKENEQFYRWTPSGSILLTTINKKAAEEFMPGREFYIDFTPTDLT
jgi:hypothetical protein